MKAMLLTEYKKLEVTDLPEPEVGSEDVLVRVKACGICGSDIHGYDGSSGRRIPPLVMGHEAAGEIVQVGKKVSRFSAGMRVTFDSTVSCGKCFYCTRGQINLCDNRMVLGVSCGDYQRYGAFAEYVVVPQNIVYELPDNLGYQQAAMIEAVSIAVHAASRTPINLGDTALVLGSGMIGLLVIQAVKLAGCHQVIAVDLEDHKLQLAKSLGADHLINASESDPNEQTVSEKIQELTGGRGADIALEVVGATASIQTAISGTRKGGSVTLIGNLSPEVEIPLQSVVTREISLLGSCASNGEYPQCIDLLASGKINVDAMITATIALEEGPAWFERLYQGEPGAMKVIIDPSAKG